MIEDSDQPNIQCFKKSMDSAETQAGLGSPQNPLSLYHYTNADGLRGIVETQKIWGTHYAYLNDASETTYAKNLFDEVLKAKIGEMTPAAAAVMNAVLNTRGGLLETAESFVACFCEQDDLLSQWRAYGSSGGYALGFSSVGLPNHVRGMTYRLKNVLYNRAVQHSLLSSFADNFATAINTAVGDFDFADIGNILFTDLDYGNARPTRVLHVPKPLRDACWAAIYRYADIAPYLKNPAFESEQEWRIVHTRSTLPMSGIADRRFRTHRGLLIPYIELDLFLGGHSMQSNTNAPPNFSLKSITVGPSVNIHKAKRSVEMLVEQYLTDAPIDIRGSKIPVKI